MVEQFINQPFDTFQRLRKSVGFLAFTLPLILLIYAAVFGECKTIQYSLSDYYYTASGDVFVGVILSISFFLIAYKGYDRVDQWLTNAAGFCAVLVALLPAGQNMNEQCSVRDVEEFAWRSTAHNVLAVLFFLILAYMSYFQFTKTSGNMTIQKVDRNKIYRICAIFMIVALALIPIFSVISIFPKVIFWMEWVAMAAFGFSWLTKGEFILADKEVG
ncbi:hypothetical protein [Aquiflexum sp.]|uniref:hypothetical protein n=1 Tax=Aquiflexum sp. TaxID=1872584 RepID=UPI003592FEC2